MLKIIFAVALYALSTTGHTGEIVAGTAAVLWYLLVLIEQSWSYDPRR